MEAGDVAMLAKEAMLLVVQVAGPMLMAALVTGVAISLLQALTQVQEMTLTFLPKMAAMGAAFLMTLPASGAAMSRFMLHLTDLVVAAR